MLEEMRDHRHLSVVRFLLPWIIPPSVVLGITQGGGWVWLAWGIVFILHPGMDAILGADSGEDPIPSRPGERVESRAHSLLLHVQLPMQLAMLAWAIPEVAERFRMFSLEWMGSVVSLGCLTGAMGITVAHELIHRARHWERALGIGLLLSVNYGHFRVEHVFGHHARVATREDPATSRRGESLYAFWPRTLVGSFRSAIEIEARRLRARPLWTRVSGNRVLHYLLLQLAIGAGVFELWGATGLAVHLAQSIFAILLLETVNYIEHYGLERRVREGGRYEPVTDLHSWDSRHVMTNAFLYNLGRHSHHHAQPTVAYERLKLAPRDQALPFGYSALLWLALFPPLWFRLFEPRLESRLPGRP
jgi:alkane 1-monooxygenase